MEIKEWKEEVVIEKKRICLIGVEKKKQEEKKERE